MDWNTSQDFSTWQNQASLFETRKDISRKQMGWKKEGSSSLSSRSDPKALFAGEEQEEPNKQCMLGSTVLLILCQFWVQNEKVLKSKNKQRHAR